LQDLLQSFAHLDPAWVYFVIFVAAYIENLFPPSPSDVIVVFGGALAAVGHGTFLLALLAGTIGSTAGFVTMYGIGRWFGRRIIEANKLRFIPIESVHTVEAWFAKYGYWIIVINRFLAGTRAVVSFFAGISELHPGRTILLSFISSMAWYSLLIYGGYSLGRHWEKVILYLTTYSQITTGVVILVVIVLVGRYLIIKGNKGSKDA
jgi:membrane protein DedA with SNARE-associated domain